VSVCRVETGTPGGGWIEGQIIVQFLTVSSLGVLGLLLDLGCI
jgi:hypothetical protein